ncbi:MAG: metallophosphoesterase [Ruminococcaceae bacterium]|nr:metallophosphoesterase [Oscillospiraceae bacterium]
MIFLLADLHGNPNFPGWQTFQNRCTEEDAVILLGDIRLNEPEIPNNEAYTAAILSSAKPVWIVDGNHENFAFLNSCPEEDWNGGRVRRLAPNVLYLQRGYVYTVAGRKIFVFGGTEPLITEKELERGFVNLLQHNFQVDYILTHDYYTRRNPEGGKPFEKMMDFIDEKVQFRQWYCGHHHLNQALDEKHTVVYDLLTPI